MAFLDALTGGAGHQAVQQQQGLIGGVYPQLNASNNQAHTLADQYLRQGFGSAGGNLATGYNTATGAINQGATGALGYLDQGTQGALGQLAQGRTDLTANGGAYAPLTALADQYGKGAGLYADSLGINGGEGNQRAVSAFQAGPGYEFARNQGIDAITRAANASGGLGGNSLRDTITYGQGLANQEYGNWQNKLAGYNPLQLSATQGAAAGNAGINQNLANLDLAGGSLLSTAGARNAGVATGQASSLADLARQYYGAQAGLDTGQGSALAGNALGEASDFQKLTMGAVNPYLDTYKQDAAVSNNASANSLKLGADLFKSGLSAFGGSSFNPLALTQSQAFQNNSWGW